MTGIETILNLLPILCSEYQELKLISQLNNIHNFDHNFLLVDSTADANHFINIKESIPQSIQVLKSGNDNVTGLETLREINSKNTFMIVVLENGRFQINLNFLHHFKKIQRLQINMKIGVFFTQFVSMDELRELFQWCKENQIINIFAATYPHPEISQGQSLLNIFSFRPFGAFDVINVTGESLKLYFQSHNFNFQQHQLRMGRPSWVYIEEFWPTVFRLMNASFIEVPMNTSELEPLEKGIDIVLQLSLRFQLTEIYLYPMSMEHMVYAVPLALPYSDFSAYLRTITSDTFLGYSSITVAAVMMLLIIFRYIKQKKMLVFQSVADVLNLLMNDNGYIKYQRLSCIEGFLIVPLTFVGLVIVNGILSSLQSFLTRPVSQHQINTVEEIFASPLPIVMHTGFRDIPEELTNRSKNVYKSDKIVVMDREEFDECVCTFNTSNSYFLPRDYAEMVVKMQKRLRIRGYHIPQIMILTYYSVYPVSDKFLFFDRLNEIIFWIQSAGLFDLWRRMGDAEGFNYIKRMNLERLKNPKETDMEQFPIPMFIVYLWVASVVVFIVEVIWKHGKLWWKQL